MSRVATAKKLLPINFREQTGVYILHDENLRIIYVCQAGAGRNDRLFEGLRHHWRDHLAERWSRFSWFGICPVLNAKLDASQKTHSLTAGEALDHIEAILIAAAEPPLNLQLGRFGKKVQQYLQISEDATQASSLTVS